MGTPHTHIAEEVETTSCAGPGTPGSHAYALTMFLISCWYPASPQVNSNDSKSIPTSANATNCCTRGCSGRLPNEEFSQRDGTTSAERSIKASSKHVQPTVYRLICSPAKTILNLSNQPALKFHCLDSRLESTFTNRCNKHYPSYPIIIHACASVQRCSNADALGS